MKAIKYMAVLLVLTLFCSCSALEENPRKATEDSEISKGVQELSQTLELSGQHITGIYPDFDIKDGFYYPDSTALLPTMSIPHAHDPIMEDVKGNEEDDENAYETEGTEEGESVAAEGDNEDNDDKDDGTVYLEDGIILDVPYINQRKDFPNGCESVSAVMALQYFDVEITPDDFIENYLDIGRSLYIENGEYMACDPREMFPGDPRNDSGWGCYPEVIKKAIDKMELTTLKAVVLKDTSLDTLCKEYIDNKIPVIFWGTIDMYTPSEWVTWRINDGSGRTHTWTSPFHCLLLVGYDSENYYFNDPWRQKNKAYSKKSVEIAYSGMGREALVLEKINP